MQIHIAFQFVLSSALFFSLFLSRHSSSYGLHLAWQMETPEIMPLCRFWFCFRFYFSVANRVDSTRPRAPDFRCIWIFKLQALTPALSTLRSCASATAIVDGKKIKAKRSIKRNAKFFFRNFIFVCTVRGISHIKLVAKRIHI